MVEEMLVKETLTKEMKEAGDDLLHRLDDAHLHVSSMLWDYVPESNSWQLVIASPDVTEHGRMKIYKKIQDILSKMPAAHAIPLRHIIVVGYTDPLVSSLRTAIQLPDVSGVSFTATQIDGHYIDDTFIYRST
jgi:hypothetical protein